MKRLAIIIVGCIAIGISSCDIKPNAFIWERKTDTTKTAPPSVEDKVVVLDYQIEQIKQYIKKNNNPTISLPDQDKYALSIQGDSIICKATTYSLFITTDSVSVIPAKAVSNITIRQDMYELLNKVGK